MEQKIYIREGRRFRPIHKVIGMFWNGKTFTKEHTSNSIAVCYDQQGKRAYMASLEVHKGINWNCAMKLALDQQNLNGCHLPTKAEASLATFRCKCLRDDNYYWTQEEYSSNYAWTWSWDSSYSFAYFGIGSKSNDYQSLCARLFFGLTL